MARVYSTPMGRPVAAVRLTASVQRLGSVMLTCIAFYTMVAWGMVRVVPFDAEEPIEGEVFARLADALAGLGPGIREILLGETQLADPTVFAIAYALPIGLACLVFLRLLAVLSRGAAFIDRFTVNALLGWAIGFAVIAAFAPPVLVQDFWLSAGWGRLAALGENPYYTSLTPEVTSGLPLDYLGLLTTYGPLWTLLSSGIMRLAGPNAWLAGLLFKTVLAAGWIGSLLLLRGVLRPRGARAQAIGIALAGWLPLGVIHGLADGHNDIAMAFLMIGWLYLVQRGFARAGTAALAGSVVMKYLSAPLFLLDVMRAWSTPAPPDALQCSPRWVRRRPVQFARTYALHAVVAAIVGLGATAVYFRDMRFFDSTRHMTGWHFFSPRAAVAAIGRLMDLTPSTASATGIGLLVMAVLVSLLFILPAVRAVLAYWQTPDDERLRRATFALVAAVLFGVSGHVWPWFLIWGLLAAALHPESWLARWTAGMAIGMCFVMVPVVAWSVAAPGVLSLGLFGFAVLFMLIIPARWFGAGGPRSSQPAS